MQRGIGSSLSIASLLGLAVFVAAPRAAADDGEVRGVQVGLEIPEDITRVNRGTVERFGLNKTRSSIRLTTFWGVEQSRLKGHIELLIEKSLRRVPPEHGMVRVEVLSAEFTAIDLPGGPIPEDRVELFLDEQEVSAGVHDPIGGWIAFSLYLKIPDRDDGFPMPIEVFGWLVDGHLTLVGDNVAEDARIEMEIDARRVAPSELAQSEPLTDLARDSNGLDD